MRSFFVLSALLTTAPSSAFAHGYDHKVESYHKDWRFDLSGLTSYTEASDKDVWLEISCPPVNFTYAVADYYLYLPKSQWGHIKNMEGRVVLGNFLTNETFFATSTASVEQDYIVIVFDFIQRGEINTKPIKFLKSTQEFDVGFEGNEDDNGPIIFSFSGAGSSAAISNGLCGD